MSETPFGGHYARLQETSDPVLSSWFDAGRNEAAESKQFGTVGTATEQAGSLRNQLSNQEMSAAYRQAASRNTEAPGLPQLDFTSDSNSLLAQGTAAFDKVRSADNPDQRLNGSFADARSETRETPFQQVHGILDADSSSSRLLGDRLLSKFTAPDCIMDMSMSPDGTVSAALKAGDGYRRTVVCRPDGKTSQRITGPGGEEIVRFTSSGQIVTALDGQRQNFERSA